MSAHDTDNAKVIAPGYTYRTVTDKVTSIVLQRKTPVSWLVGFALVLPGALLLQMVLTMILLLGVGVWGVNQPVGWGFDIVNFVWWVGIGHAGTLISAVLLLFRQKWRTSINRFAEAMTLFAVACAGLFPIFHMGRPYLFYWLLPLPNTFGLWPQFRSPLVWDVFAISAYATVSLLFWYVGLIPDFATLRDRARRPIAKYLYGFFALGWRGSARHWMRYERMYLLLAGLATPLVLSVHSIVGLDFAASVIPGWHSTFFPPYFVAGAIFSGFAMVMTLAIPLRKVYGLQDFITDHHLDNMAKVMLATGLIVAYSYFIEVFYAWYSGNPYEWFMMVNRMAGPYAPFFWALIFCNAVVPQLFWIPKIRTHIPSLFVLSILINIGMWLERFVIVVTSLHRDYLPSSWGMYKPTIFDIGMYVGTIGFFLTLFFLFIRFIPVISIFEMRELVPEPQEESSK